MTQKTKEEGRGEKEARTRRRKRDIQKKTTVKMMFGNDDKGGRYKRDVMGGRGQRRAVSKRTYLPLEKERKRGEHKNVTHV